jgi:hypothetical protein
MKTGHDLKTTATSPVTSFQNFCLGSLGAIQTSLGALDLLYDEFFPGVHIGRAERHAAARKSHG